MEYGHNQKREDIIGKEEGYIADRRVSFLLFYWDRAPFAAFYCIFFRHRLFQTEIIKNYFVQLVVHMIHSKANDVDVHK